MQYYFRAQIGGRVGTYALVSEYSAPDPTLFSKSSGALFVSRYYGQDCLKVINAKSILSAVAMVPYPHAGLGSGKWHFLVEKMGLEMFGFRGDEEADEEEGESLADDAEPITVDIPHSRDSSEDVEQAYDMPKEVEAVSAVDVSEGVLGALPSALGTFKLSRMTQEAI